MAEETSIFLYTCFCYEKYNYNIVSRQNSWHYNVVHNEKGTRVQRI